MVSLAIFGLTAVVAVHSVSGFIFIETIFNEIVHHTTPEPTCMAFHEYQELKNLPVISPCTSITQVWPALNSLKQKSPHCLDSVIKELAGVDWTSYQCSCTGFFSQVNMVFLGGNHDHFDACKDDHSCAVLLGHFFHTKYQSAQMVPCEVHAKVWHYLNTMGTPLGVDVRDELIQHIGSQMMGTTQNTCQCKFDTKATVLPTLPDGLHHVTNDVTSGNPSATPLFGHASVPTATSHVHYRRCFETRTLSAIVTERISTNPEASVCASGQRTSSEAFVLDYCDIDSPKFWTEGQNVMENCQTVPMYTPIATFGTRYLGIHDDVGVSGILIGCTSDGFKVAVQKCDAAPTVLDLHTGGANVLNPHLYFVIN